jgi:ABC-2 type transport system permease protein
MSWTMRKWWALFSIYFQETFAYRASMIIWILTDIVTSLTMPLVWIHSNALAKGPIQGFDQQGIVLYYLCNLLIIMFVTSHIMWDLAMEIKEGQFTAHLLRPFSIFQLTFVRNLTWRILRTSLCLPIFLFFLWAFRGYLAGADVYLGPWFWICLILGHLVSFFTVYALAMIAMIVQEAHSLFELYYVPMLFLSGQLFPVSMLPDWARNLSYAFPFYFTAGLPTEVLVGKVTPSQAPMYALVQLGWIALAAVLGQWTWRVGRRHYTAVGM